MRARTVVLAVGDQVAVFTAWPPQCTARTRSRPRASDPRIPRGGPFRCSHPVVYGIPRAPEFVDVGPGRLEAIPLEGELGARLLAQRCVYHVDELAQPYCEPEWTPFDPGRPEHRALLVDEHGGPR